MRESDIKTKDFHLSAEMTSRDQEIIRKLSTKRSNSFHKIFTHLLIQSRDEIKRFEKSDIISLEKVLNRKHIIEDSKKNIDLRCLILGFIDFKIVKQFR